MTHDATKPRRSFDALLAEGQLDAPEVRALAEALAKRHAAAERAPDFAPDTVARHHALAHLAERLASLSRGDAENVTQALQRARHFLDHSADRLLARAGASRVLAKVEALRLGEVFALDDGEAAIEVSAREDAARADDPVLELAHLSVALSALGRGDLAERLVSHYAGVSEDFDLYPVLDFYEDLCVIERFTLDEALEQSRGDDSQPQARRLGPPMLLVTSGQVASGKSSVARELADHFGAARTIADRIRDHLVHGVAGRPVHEAGWAEGFEPGFGQHVYAELLRRGELVLATGRSVVLDACFPTRRERDAARALARRMNVPFRFVECRVDPETQRERLSARDEKEDEDGAWLAIARDFDERFVPPDELASGERITVDSSGALADTVAFVLDALERSTEGSGRTRSALPKTPGAVTFDCWQTLLVEADWAVAHARRVDALIEAARELGRDVSRERAHQAFDHAWGEHMLAWTRGVATGAPEVARHAFSALRVDPSQPVLDALIVHWQEASHSGRVEALPGAHETLEELARRGIPRALVCDTGLTPGRVVRQLLASVGLLERLDVCAFSDEVGAPKPDRRIFAAALTPLGVDPSGAVHVGDLRRTDVAGARALGMGTIRLRAAHDDPGPLPEADEVADSHEDVLRLLGVS